MNPKEKQIYEKALRVDCVTIKLSEDVTLDVYGYYNEGQKGCISSIELSIEPIAPSFDIKKIMYKEIDIYHILFELDVELFTILEEKILNKYIK